MKQIKRTIFLALMVCALICPKVLADNDGTASSDNKYIFSGKDIVHTGTSNGYSGDDSIEKGDDHYGWVLGDFYVTGFTSYIQDADGTVVFLKNAGDDVKLSYHLLQDIDKLNDDDDLEIHSDGKAWDEYFKTKTYQNSKGLLVIQHTDYQNKTEEPLVYESFLEGKVKGAETDIHFCEEGDYEVAFDYEIEVDGSIIGIIDKDSYEDYRQYFKFKVRNGNCMIFPLDLSGNELTNESYSEDGFVIDFAKSRYLKIDVKYKVLVEGRDGLAEDVRYNRPAADGEKYDQPGIYEITIKNQYTQSEMTKTIYVGEDPSIKMMAIDGMSIDEVNKSLYQETTEVTLPTDVTENDSVENFTQDKSEKEKTNNNQNTIIVVCAVASVAIIALVFVVVAILKKSRKKNTSFADNSGENSELCENKQIDISQTALNERVSGSKYIHEDIDALPYNGRVSNEPLNNKDQSSDDN